MIVFLRGATKRNKVNLSGNLNKPGSAEVGAISKAQKYQKDFKMSKYW